jgi:hypothetical protein
MKLAGRTRAAKRQVGPRRRRGALTRGSGQHCEGSSQSQGRRRRRANAQAGQAARTSPGAGPERALQEETPGTNDPHGRRPRRDASTPKRSTRATDASAQSSRAGREARKPQGRRDHGLGVGGRNERRSGMVREAGSPRTARRGQLTSQGGGRNRKRDAPNRSVRRAIVGRRIGGAGDEGTFAGAGPFRGGSDDRRRTAPGVNRAGEGRRRDARKERKPRRRRHPKVGPRDRKVPGHGQANRSGRPWDSILRVGGYRLVSGTRRPSMAARPGPSRPRCSEADGGRTAKLLPVCL